MAEEMYMSYTHTFVSKFAWHVLKMAEEIYKFKDNTLSVCLRSELYTHICIKIYKLWAQNGRGKFLKAYVCFRYELFTLISIKIFMTGAQNGGGNI